LSFMRTWEICPQPALEKHYRLQPRPHKKRPPWLKAASCNCDRWIGLVAAATATAAAPTTTAVATAATAATATSTAVATTATAATAATTATGAIFAGLGFVDG
jgi:hypothetical protein